MDHEIYVSKDMCPKTQIETEHVDEIAFELTIGFIIYVYNVGK